MANKMLTCSAVSTLVSNRASPSPLLIGLGPSSGLPLKTPSSKPSFVVKAQQAGGPRRIEPSPRSAEQIQKKVVPFDTSPHEKLSRFATEDEHEIRMQFDMPGLAVENIEMKVEDDVLVIRRNGGVDAYGNKILSHCDSRRIQLPRNSFKEKITAVFKNGVLHITVPKITQFEQKVIHIPIRSI